MDGVFVIRQSWVEENGEEDEGVGAAKSSKQPHQTSSSKDFLNLLHLHVVAPA